MKAFLNDGQGLGCTHSSVTGEYKTFGMFYRYAIVPFLKSHDGRCKAEIFYNWDNRYKEADNIMSWNTHILEKQND